MQMIYKVHEGSATPHELATAEVARVLNSGGMALIPTETVYGLAAAVEASLTGNMPSAGYRRIFSLKERDAAQTLPWLVADEAALDRYGKDVSEAAHKLARAFWPGALTIVVKAKDSVPAFMQAGDGTVALRASASPVAQELIRACGSPLACTSANTHGAPAPASFESVEPRVLGGADVAVDAGATPCQEASTIVSFQTGELEVLRQGAISKSDIENVLAA